MIGVTPAKNIGNFKQMSRKMDENGRKWIKMDENGQEMAKNDENGQKMAENGRKLTKMDAYKGMGVGGL